MDRELLMKSRALTRVRTKHTLKRNIPNLKPLATQYKNINIGSEEIYRGGSWRPKVRSMRMRRLDL